MRAAQLRTDRFVLEALTGENADRLAADLVPVLADRALYRYIGGGPPTQGDLVGRLRRQAVGTSPDGRACWLNWVVRRADDGTAVGTVQATVALPPPAGGESSRSTRDEGTPRPDGGGPARSMVGPTAVAWVVGAEWQGRGYAVEAAAAVLRWLCEAGVTEVTAWIHPDNAASQAVAARLGMRRTGAVLDGEDGWVVRLRPESG